MTFKALLVGLAALLIAACNPIENINQTEDRIAEFERLYSNGDVDALYSMTGKAWRELSTREEFDDLHRVVSTRLGKVTASERSNFNINTTNGLTTTVIVMETEFEQGTGTQTFTFHGNGDEMELVGWNVNSPRLAITVDDLQDGEAEPAEAE